MLISPKNNEAIILKRNKNIFTFLGPTRIDLGPTYSHSNEKSGLRSSLKDNFFKKELFGK